VTERQELSSGSPGGLTSEDSTASLERFQAASHFAYWPFSIRWSMASAIGSASPLSFLVVAAISPWREAPAPDYVPALRVALGDFAVWVMW